MRRTLAILASATVAASTIALATPAQAADTISGGGASFPFPFLSACAADFNASQSAYTIQYTSTGSGTGKSNFKKGVFVYGQTDSKYATSADEPDFGWEYIPNIGGAIAFPINLKNAKTGRTLGSSIQLRQTTLSKLLSGNLTTWRDPEILKDNPRIAASIPNVPVTVAYRSGNSGTSNNTLQYLNAWAPTIWSKVQDDFSTAFPGGKPPANSVSGKDNASVMALVNAKPGTIGYVDYSDAKGYPVARIQNANGEFVAPSAASAAKNLANQTNIAPNGLVALNYKVAVPGAYPAAIFSYMLVHTVGGPKALGVRQFADYVLQKCGPAKAASLGYVPVAGKVLATAKTFVQKIK